MSRRFVIPCLELENHYLRQHLSAQAIGDIYGCSASTVVRRLNDCGVQRRQGSYRQLPLDEGELLRMYLDQRLPLTVIARQLGVVAGTIINRLRSLGVPPRSRITTRSTLRALWRSGLSIDTAARLGQVGPGAVVAAIVDAQRRPAVAHVPLPTPEQRAYLTGLGRSWLQAERADDGSGAVVAYATCKQLPEQGLFAAALGSVFQQISLGDAGVARVVLFPGSWGFLLAREDRLPNWLRGEPRLLYPLLAGLVDGGGFLMPTATGPLIVVEAAAHGLLRGVAAELTQRQVRSAIRLIEPAPPGLWRLQMSGSDSRPLLAALAPYLQHPVRRQESQYLASTR